MVEDIGIAFMSCALEKIRRGIDGIQNFPTDGAIAVTVFFLVVLDQYGCLRYGWQNSQRNNSKQDAAAQGLGCGFHLVSLVP